MHPCLESLLALDKLPRSRSSRKDALCTLLTERRSPVLSDPKPGPFLVSTSLVDARSSIHRPKAITTRCRLLSSSFSRPTSPPLVPRFVSSILPAPSGHLILRPRGYEASPFFELTAVAPFLHSLKSIYLERPRSPSHSFSAQ